MGYANIKISSDDIEKIKEETQEETGQKAVQKALVYFLNEAKQRRITKLLGQISFRKGFDPLRVRRHER